uniref:Uncharacterized protein n=1 Tax=viral metagenome TaxID=1070528 RepID=A0A6C0JAJ7_9ZZZZ
MIILSVDINIIHNIMNYVDIFKNPHYGNKCALCMSSTTYSEVSRPEHILKCNKCLRHMKFFCSNKRLNYMNHVYSNEYEPCKCRGANTITNGSEIICTSCKCSLQHKMIRF